MIQREEVCELVLRFLEDIQRKNERFEQKGAKCRSFSVCISVWVKKMEVEIMGKGLHEFWGMEGRILMNYGLSMKNRKRV